MITIIINFWYTLNLNTVSPRVIERRIDKTIMNIYISWPTCSREQREKYGELYECFRAFRIQVLSLCGRKLLKKSNPLDLVDSVSSLRLCDRSNRTESTDSRLDSLPEMYMRSMWVLRRNRLNRCKAMQSVDL